MSVIPLADLADTIRTQSAPWVLMRQQAYANLGAGELLGSDRGPALWSAPVTTINLNLTASKQLQARLEGLNGVLTRFYMYDPKCLWPQSDPNGSILGSATVQIGALNADNVQMKLKGLPAGYILTVGDKLSFDYGSPARRAMHRIRDTVAADGSGVTPYFRVSPHIRTGAAVDDVVTLVKPNAKVILVPDSIEVSQSDLLFEQVSFKIRQTLVADS